MEIYAESKHGAVYRAEGHTWVYHNAKRPWTAGKDYRTPTCAVCHMSAAGRQTAATHNVSERLSWELQAPLTVHPQDFDVFPAQTSWRAERIKMKTICRQCHGESWTEAHFRNLDKAVAIYNNAYYLPAQKAMKRLYDTGILTGETFRDEDLEWIFYEFWSHEGRRARMGVAMTAPDFAWWHGFYVLKKRLLEIKSRTDDASAKGQVHRYETMPGAFEETNK
jgi:hypothetical protein